MKQERLGNSGNSPESLEGEASLELERERADKLRKLKEQIRNGTYEADIKDIAMQISSAMNRAV